MEDLIESQLESVVPIFFAALFSFVFANFIPVLLGLLVVVLVIVFIVLKTKHGYTTRLLKNAQQLQHQTATQLSGVLVSTDTFRDLDLGLAAGETEGRLRHMQESAIALHQQSQELAERLKARPAFFSLVGAVQQAKSRMHEAEDLHQRVQRYLQDMSSIGHTVKKTTMQMRQLEDRLKAVTEQITQLEAETGFPLEVLKEQLKQVNLTFNQLDSLTAFDSLQAEPELVKLDQSIDSLLRRATEHRKSIALFREMQERVKRVEDSLQRQLEEEGQPSVRGVKRDELLRRKNEIVAQIEASLRSGRQVDLRAAALDIESILREASEMMQ